jgi:hypothetical protein
MLRTAVQGTGLALMAAASVGAILDHPEMPGSWMLLGMTFITFGILIKPEKKRVEEDW